MTQYIEFRKDGWPLCPRCGEDELASRAHLNYFGVGEQPTIADGIASGMVCYKCGWDSESIEDAIAKARDRWAAEQVERYQLESYGDAQSRKILQNIPVTP